MKMGNVAVAYERFVAHPDSEPVNLAVEISSDSVQTSPAPAPAASPSNADDPNELVFLGVNLAFYSQNVQFVVLAASVFVFYFVYALAQEFIFNRLPGFKYGVYLTFLQFLQYVAITGYQLYTSPKSEPRRAPMGDYALIGVLSVTTMCLSNVSLQYLNYPTQTMFKSCKLIPVMIVGVFFLGKKYSPLDYLAMVSLTVGMIIFSVGDSLVKTEFSTTGVILICLALAADALIGNVQEKSMNKYNSSSTEMIFYSKGLGCGFLFLILIVTGELAPAFSYCWENPSSYIYFAIFATVGCAGEFFVMALVKQFGALLTATVTSCRKLVSIAVSFLLFPKPFTFIYVIGGIQVFFGIGLEIYLKNSKAFLQVIDESRMNGCLASIFPLAKPSV